MPLATNRGSIWKLLEAHIYRRSHSCKHAALQTWTRTPFP